MDHPPALAYLRLSRALGDPDDPGVLAAHRAALVRVMQSDGIEAGAIEWVQEIGSGDSIRYRPAFRALLERFERGPAAAGGVLYCLAVDRLSRGSMSEVGRVVDALVHAGIEIRTPERRYDLSRADDELFYAFVAALSRHELGRYRQRVALKWREMTLAGEILSGRAPYGYAWDRNTRTFVIIPAEFAVVEALFREALTASTYRLGARYGLRPSQVCCILHNPVYTGWPARHLASHRWRGGEGSKGARRLPPSEWLWPEQPGSYPPACSRDQFIRVQEALAQRERERTKTGSTNGWCRDIVEFEDRPGVLIELGSHGRRPEKRYLTYCTSPRYGKRIYVARSVVHAAALSALRELFSAPEVLRRALASAPAASENGTPDEAATFAALQAARRTHDELVTMEARSTDPEERASIYRTRTAALAEIEALRRRLAPAPGAADPVALRAALIAALPALAARFDAAWEELDEAARRAIAAGTFAALLIRITPAPGRRPWLREVVAVQYQPWLEGARSGDM